MSEPEQFDPDEPTLDWDLSYYLRATRSEAERIYDALQTLLCSCENHDGGCRIPVSGMHPCASLSIEEVS